jgi:hypothetical protein
VLALKDLRFAAVRISSRYLDCFLPRDVPGFLDVLIFQEFQQDDALFLEVLPAQEVDFRDLDAGPEFQALAEFEFFGAPGEAAPQPGGERQSRGEEQAPAVRRSVCRPGVDAHDDKDDPDDGQGNPAARDDPAREEGDALLRGPVLRGSLMIFGFARVLLPGQALCICHRQGP